jgi:hypothetical protein
MAGLGLGIVGFVVVVLYREPLARWFRSHMRHERSTEQPQWSREIPKSYRHVVVHRSGGAESSARRVSPRTGAHIRSPATRDEQ